MIGALNFVVDALKEKGAGRTKGICILVPAIIADDLGKLAAGALEDAFGKVPVSVLCLWESYSVQEQEILSVVDRQYFDGVEGLISDVILVDDGLSPLKLIVSRISRVISMLEVDSFFVVAPKIDERAKTALLSEFPMQISSKISFIDTDLGEVRLVVEAALPSLVGNAGVVRSYKGMPQLIRKRRAEKFNLISGTP